MIQSLWKKRFFSLLTRALFLGSICFTSCGYHWQERSLMRLYLPFVQGDPEGSLTQAVAQELITTQQASLTSSSEATHRLELSVVQSNTQMIGYRYRKNQKTGALQSGTTPCEGRNLLKVKGKLIDQKSNQCIYGPFYVEAETDFDFLDGESLQDLVFIDTEGQQQTALSFSLGQLEPKEPAQEAAIRVVYQRIGEKIARTLFFTSSDQPKRL